MPEYTMEYQGTETMLVCHLSKEESVDGYAKGMLQNNDIEGVIKPLFSQRDTDQYLKYKVTSRISLHDLNSNDWKRDMFLRVIRSIVSSLKEAEEYMLTETRFLLDMEHIYVNVTSKRVYLIYVPLVDEVQGKTLKEFLREFITAVKFDLCEDTSYVAELINAVNRKEFLDLSVLQEDIIQMMSEQKPAQKTESKELYSNPFKEPVIPPIKTEPATKRQIVPVPNEGLIEEEPLTTSNPPKKGLFGWLKKDKKKNNKVETIETPPTFIGFDIPGQSDERIVTPPTPSFDVPPEMVMNVDPDNGRMTPAKKGLFTGLRKEKKGRQTVYVLPDEEPESTQPIGENFIEQQRGAGSKERDIPEGRTAQSTTGYNSESAGQSGVSRPVGDGNSVEYSKAGVSRPVEVGNSVVYGAGNSSESNTTIILGGGDEEGHTLSKGGGSSDERVSAIRIVTLQRRRNGQKIAISNPSFKIGSNGGFVDFYVGDNAAIGAMHAEIQKSNGRFFVRDLNSLNHTYVNQELVMAGELKELHNGDVITLADEEFEFVVR